MVRSPRREEGVIALAGRCLWLLTRYAVLLARYALLLARYALLAALAGLLRLSRP